ncbi:hypothetical protein PV04_08886 [Phialophora macrospora]|uniref:Heterokaryon incompatibility domain-containing protein n=1 Tax=Phialophora macrospora TaxID=1851006 RepID=A0A0D2DNU1_9EURO|nr:hypothetical protein PV04_08886 [Phialophora macrospora]
MSTPADILREEAALGRWPRRLLHIDTMTSCEWQPGNRYGSASEPAYAAITYTWGRWKLKNNEMTHVRAIGIKGTPWNIPRVNPTIGFTVKALQTVIERASTFPLSTNSGVPRRVEFVWLDIACIDQRDGSLKAASEMGRQAGIFRGASFVFAWLSTLSIRQLNHIFRARNDFWRPNPEAALDALSKLTSDPWFSSLWTLQEAYLRTDAVFLSRDAQVALDPSGGQVTIDQFHPPCFTLRAAAYFVNELKSTTSEISGFVEKTWSQSTRRAYDQAVALGNKTGLYALSLRNPTATLILAQHRTAERREDKVYGIQQIFNLRLGKTAPGWRGRVYSLEELEDDLAKQLLAHYPVQSQMHVFTKAAAFATAWRLNVSSAFPKMNEPYSPGVASARIADEDRRQVVKPTCKLWTEERGGILWGRFHGKACKFDFWTKVLDEVDDRTMGGYAYVPALTVFLDVTPEFNNCPDHGAPANDLVAQRRLIGWLSKTFPSGRLKVLELGIRDFPSGEGRFDLWGPLSHGLLLVLKQAHNFQYYHRVGFCTWYDGSIGTRMEAVAAKEWKELNGRFG